MEIGAQESRQIQKSDFERFDLILVMDSSNRRDVLALAGDREEWQSKVHMFLDDGDVPDPYFGGNSGFVKVHDLLNEAADSWTDKWRGP